MAIEDIEDTLRACSKPGARYATGWRMGFGDIMCQEPPVIELELAIRLVKEHESKLKLDLAKRLEQTAPFDLWS